MFKHEWAMFITTITHHTNACKESSPFPSVSDLKLYRLNSVEIQHLLKGKDMVWLLRNGQWKLRHNFSQLFSTAKKIQKSYVQPRTPKMSFSVPFSGGLLPALESYIRKKKSEGFFHCKSSLFFREIRVPSNIMTTTGDFALSLQFCNVCSLLFSQLAREH